MNTNTRHSERTDTQPPQTDPSTPPANRWVIPEGDYRARFKKMRAMPNGKVRLTFDVAVPGSSFTHHAARNYGSDLSESSPLRNDLLLWRGHDVTPAEWQSGSIDFDPLIGSSVDLRLQHLCSGNHLEPFVCIKAIYAPGTLVRTESSEGKAKN